MKKISFLLTISLLFIYSFVSAQSRTSTVTGTVIDEQTNEPLPGAVIIIDSTKHAITDVQGKFSLAGVPRKTVKMEVSFLGYKTLLRDILVGGTTFSAGTISLTPEFQQIDAVVVTGSSAMATQKGDTVQYNAAAFKVNPDADASDLVSKMPGVTVENGTVEAQGETVARVYVDGKLLFGDDAMAALNNLPADAIESIQVFDEMSDEAKFTGFDDGERTRALNVVTKHKRNRSTIARVNGGYGTTIDEHNADFKNRFNFRGDYSSFTENNRISLFANSTNVNNRDGANSSGLFTRRQAGLGVYNKWKNDLELTVNYRYNDNQNVRKTTTLRDYFPTDQFDSRIYNDTTSNKNNAKTHNAEIRLEYKINDKNKLLFIPRLTITDNTTLSLRRASNIVNDEVNSITNTDSRSLGDNFSTNGMLLYTHVFNKPGRTISTHINYSLSKNTSDAFQIDTTDNTTKPRNLNTLQDIWNKSLNVRASYGEPIGDRQRLEFSYAFRVEDNKSDRRVYDYLINTETGELDQSLSNNYSRNYYSHTVGTAYNLNHDKIKINAGVNYRNIRLMKDQIYPTIDKQNRNFNVWEPRLTLTRYITKQKYFRINYRASTEIPSVEQFQNVINSNNLLQLTAGNPNLKPSVNHNIFFNYNSSNVEKSTNYFLGIRLSAANNRISNRTVYFEEETTLSDYNNFVAQQGSQLTTPVNLNGYVSARMFTGFGFPLTFIKTNVNIGGSYGYAHTPSYTGTLLNYANSNSADIMVRLASNISENVDFNITSRTGYSYVTNSAKTDTKYLSERVTARLNLIFLRGFVFNTDFTYNYDHNASKTGFTQEYYMWNAGIGRKFLRKRQAELRLTVYDILKQNKNLVHTIGDQYIEDQWNNVIGRYAMLTFSYKFNSMNTMSRSAAARAAAEASMDSGERRRPGPPSGGPGGGRPMGPPPGGGRGPF